MVDVISNDRMVVRGEAVTGAHITVPLPQLSAVTDVLTRGGITFWVPKEVLVWHGELPAVVVSLGRSSDTAAVQRLLDTI